MAGYGMGLAFGSPRSERAAAAWWSSSVEVLAMGAVVWCAVRRLGGYTGDVLGAMGVIGETVGLLTLAAK